MRFLSVAERELRAGARQKATHRLRWITAGVFFAFLVWLMWVFNGFRAPQIFHAFSAITLFYCLAIGTARTADCLSSEKREGTMGLLFLTNLNGPEIIGGKLCSSAVAAAYGLFAIFPLLALQMLVGGITLDHFWRVILALLDAIIFAIASGFLASSIFVRQFTAIAWATGVALFFSAGLMAAAALISTLGGTIIPRSWVEGLVIFSPLYTLISADGFRGMFGPNHYWWSVLVVGGLSLLFLGVATWRVSRSWQDRPGGVPVLNKLALLQRWRLRGQSGRKSLRRRLLDINPFYWLGDRRRVSAPVFMLLTLAIVPITSYLAAPFFARVLRAGVFSPVLGHLMAWLWAGMLIHALVLYYAAMMASRRLAEDKQTGALELVLSTPATERSISRGLWMAYARRMLFPATVAILVHCFFIWQGLTMFLLDSPGTTLPHGTTAATLFWHVLLNVPFAGHPIEWQFVMALRIVLLLLVLCICVWTTLGWLARWFGLRMKHPGFAPMISLALIIVPPIVLFFTVCYCADQWHLTRLPERIFIPVMMWVAFGIGLMHCALLSIWAAGRLRTEFRNVVTSRFQPKVVRSWWRPAPGSLVRLGIGSLATAAALAIIVLSFYGYQNWRSHHAWSAFQRELKQRKVSLDLAPVLPGPVPDTQNFALTPAFLNCVSTATNAAIKRLLLNLKDIDTLASGTQSATLAAASEWTAQTLAPLDDYLAWVAPAVTLRNKATREEFAAALLANLKPQDDTLRSIATGARLAYFQPVISGDASKVLDSSRTEYSALERLHMLFVIRASALLATNHVSEAQHDLMTALQLARLSQQIPDAQSPMRTQVLLVRSLQPLWEGVIERRWTETQLAGFQAELSRFNLLANYTNAIHRVVLAHIALWHQIADGQRIAQLPALTRQSQLEEPVWQMQPRAWWLDHCVQLYRAGESAIASVDVAGSRVQTSRSWADLEGLPVDGTTSFLFSQAYWPGAYPGNVVFAQTAVNQGILACALERFRLEHGKYPETLAALVPTFLSSIPADVVRGQPMLYENPRDGRFVLRSVGPNQIDDRTKPSSDDWLWSFPTNAPSLK